MVLDHGLLVWGIGGQARGRGICVGFSSWPEAEEASPFYVHWRSSSKCSLNTFYRLVHVLVLEHIFFVPKIQSFSTFFHCLVHVLLHAF